MSEIKVLVLNESHLTPSGLKRVENGERVTASSEFFGLELGRKMLKNNIVYFRGYAKPLRNRFPHNDIWIKIGVYLSIHHTSVELTFQSISYLNFTNTLVLYSKEDSNFYLAKGQHAIDLILKLGLTFEIKEEEVTYEGTGHSSDFVDIAYINGDKNLNILKYMTGGAYEVPEETLSAPDSDEAEGYYPFHQSV